MEVNRFLGGQVEDVADVRLLQYTFAPMESPPNSHNERVPWWTRLNMAPAPGAKGVGQLRG